MVMTSNEFIPAPSPYLVGMNVEGEGLRDVRMRAKRQAQDCGGGGAAPGDWPFPVALTQ